MQVDSAEWNTAAVASGELNPFVLHGFLKALEDSKSAVSSQNNASCMISELAHHKQSPTVPECIAGEGERLVSLPFYREGERQFSRMLP